MGGRRGPPTAPSTEYTLSRVLLGLKGGGRGGHSREVVTREGGGGVEIGVRVEIYGERCLGGVEEIWTQGRVGSG